MLMRSAQWLANRWRGHGAISATGRVHHLNASNEADEIAPGHLVIAQEALDYGWWEAIVLGRNGDMFTLRFRDYPKLPKFVRHRNAIALMSPPAE